MQAADVVAAPVLSYAEVASEPHFWDNGYLRTMQGPGGAEQVVQGQCGSAVGALLLWERALFVSCGDVRCEMRARRCRVAWSQWLWERCGSAVGAPSERAFFVSCGGETP